MLFLGCASIVLAPVACIGLGLVATVAVPDATKDSERQHAEQEHPRDPNEQGVAEPAVVLPESIHKPSDDTLAKIEYLLDSSMGVRVMRDWGLETRAKADDGHEATLIACRLVGPGLEDGPIAIFTKSPINPVSGLAKELCEALPNRHWSVADKAVQTLVDAARALRDGRAVLSTN